MIYRAVVVDTADPDHNKRVRVRCDDLYGRSISGWVAACLPTPLTAAPTVGSKVWITHEANDLAKPVWIGYWS